MVSAQSRWQLTGDYFENCNCDVVCPCLFSPQDPLTSEPSQGACEVALAFHIDQGFYGSVRLDDLNVLAVGRSPGPMAQGNWAMGVYLDARADDAQREALGSIFGGGAGGPMAAFAPLVGSMLGVKVAPITYRRDGKQRSVEIPNVAHLSVHALPSLGEDAIWVAAGHPINPDKLALAVGDPGSTFQDYGMRWDNSGKNGHFAEISWSNS